MFSAQANRRIKHEESGAFSTGAPRMSLASIPDSVRASGVRIDERRTESTGLVLKTNGECYDTSFVLSL